jgi:glycosyltransferase involved in cell wall biosynthesis
VPEVSVVIPARNAAAFVGAAIESVLRQTFRDFELLVVDNGSTDDTARIAATYPAPVRCLSEPRAGVAFARNRGLRESRGRWIAFLDADDLWLPPKLEAQLRALRSRPGARACSTAFEIVDSALRPLAVKRHPLTTSLLEELLFVGNVIGPPSTPLIERELLVRENGFDPELSYGADWNLWIRLAACTELAYVDEVLVRYRVHDSNMSRNVRLLEDDSRRVLTKAFAMPGLPPSLEARRRESFGWNDLVLAGSYWRAGQRAAAVRCALQALAWNPRLGARLLSSARRSLSQRQRAAT